MSQTPAVDLDAPYRYISIAVFVQFTNCLPLYALPAMAPAGDVSARAEKVRGRHRLTPAVLAAGTRQFESDAGHRRDHRADGGQARYR